MDLTGLINSGATMEEILAALRGDFEATVGRFKNDSTTAYQDAIQALEGFYENAAQDRSVSFADRYNLLSDNLANLGMEFDPGQWNLDQTYLTEAADTALATDLAWFEKVQALQNDFYNALLTEMAANIALAQAAPVGSGGSGGGFGRGGGRGGGGSSSGDTQDVKIQNSLTAEQNIQRDFPGFIEYLNENFANNQYTPDQWAWMNAMINEFNQGGPEDMLSEVQKAVNEQATTALAAMDLIDNLQNRDYAFEWEGQTIPSLELEGDRKVELVSDERERDLRRALRGGVPTGISMQAFEALSSGANSRADRMSPAYRPGTEADDNQRRIYQEALETRYGLQRQRADLEEDARRQIAEAGQFQDDAFRFTEDLREFVPLFGQVMVNEKLKNWGRESTSRTEERPADAPISAIDTTPPNLIQRAANRNMQQQVANSIQDQINRRTAENERSTRQAFANAREAEQRAAWERRAAREQAAAVLAERERQERAAWANRARPTARNSIDRAISSNKKNSNNKKKKVSSRVPRNVR